jgi:hypothetical protein
MDTRIGISNDETVGPQLDIVAPQQVEVKYNGRTLWINVDGVCRLRIGRAIDVTFDTPGFTQREVEG